PQLLLLDEPTAGVDPKARRDFWDEIRRLAGRGVTVLVSTHYMDEAIQCDFITYIAYGRKLIDGRAAEIPALVGLETWRVEGPDLPALEDRLKDEPGVEQVARFGAVLHISGTDRERLRETVRRLEAEGTHRFSLQVAGLEEAFIYLMAGARDNFANGGERQAA
ncbi:MAG TPA: AAA family ATPase, partial [Alphaproteobacteria bacterium]|nr:AAA family ATPase [Alphaproteobacteria bacterium]